MITLRRERWEADPVPRWNDPGSWLDRLARRVDPGRRARRLDSDDALWLPAARGLLFRLLAAGATEAMGSGRRIRRPLLSRVSEDVDLCFALARAGFRTLLQPRSRLIHHETASRTSPRKTFLLLRHRETFRRKWAAALETREVAGVSDPRAVACAIERARDGQHLLIIDDRPPQRGCGAGFSVLLDAIEAIDGTGYAISVAVSDRLDGDLSLLAELGVHVMRERPESVLADMAGVFDRVLASRPHNFVRFAPLVREHQPQAALAYLTEALFYRRMQRQLELVTDRQEREQLTAEMLRYRELERAIPLAADEIICVSDEEAAILASVDGHCPIEMIRPVVSGLAPTAAGYETRSGVLFTPGWLAGDASPNIDALRWFVTAVLPRVIEARPDFRLLVTERVRHQPRRLSPALRSRSSDSSPTSARSTNRRASSSCRCGLAPGSR